MSYLVILCFVSVTLELFSMANSPSISLFWQDPSSMKSWGREHSDGLGKWQHLDQLSCKTLEVDSKSVCSSIQMKV